MRLAILILLCAAVTPFHHAYANDTADAQGEWRHSDMTSISRGDKDTRLQDLRDQRLALRQEWQQIESERGTAKTPDEQAAMQARVRDLREKQQSVEKEIKAIQQQRSDASVQ